MSFQSLKLPTLLAATPQHGPKYSVKIKNDQNQEVELTDPRASRTLIALMDFYAVNGGAASHWGGPSAFAEIMSAIHGIMFSDKSTPWFEQFNFVNDAGHAENGVYAVRANYQFADMTFKDLLKFRSIESPLTGHGESHINPQGVLLSNGPLSSSIAQAQGLAFADKMLNKSRVTLLTVSDGALMEGEAKETLASLPGMAKKEKINPFVMVISDNNTKLSGRISDDSFSMKPTFESLSVLGWNVVEVSDGHNLEDVYRKISSSIKQAIKDPTKPIAIWAKTIKGKGVASTEDSSSGGHGFPIKKWDKSIIPFIQEIYSNQAPDEFLNFASEALENTPTSSPSSEVKVKKEKVQVGIANALIKARKEGLPIFSFSSDLAGSTGLKNFQKEYSDSFFDIGIAESNMISVASGAAKNGLIPIVDTFAQFGVTKGNLPLTMASLSDAPVIAIFSHTGMQDAADGASHQATAYYSAIASIPNTKIISCSCSQEAENYLYQAIKMYQKERESGKQAHNYVFFLGRETFPQSLGQSFYPWEKAQVLAEGTAATIVSHGPLIYKAIKANELLKEQGKPICSIINHPFLSSIDSDIIKTQLEKTGNNLISIEDHQVWGGLGAAIAHQMAQHDIPVKMRSLGIQNHFGRSAYMADQLYSHFKMDEQAILETLSNL